MKRVSPLLLLFILTACGGVIPPPDPIDPPQPKPVQLAVVVCEGTGAPGDSCQGLTKLSGAQLVVDGLQEQATNVNGFAEASVQRGAHSIRVQSDDYIPSSFTTEVNRSSRWDVRLQREHPPVLPLSTSGKVFTHSGQPWRWKGVTAFKLARLHADGQNIDAFLDAYKGYNVLRVFDYAVVNAPGFQWESPSPDQMLAFIRYVGDRGWYVELVLLTDDASFRVENARLLVEALKAARPPNVVFEIGNEPNTNKHIDTSALRSTLQGSGFLFSSGDYDDSPKFFGTFGTYHSGRDDQWPRRAHDAQEYWAGGGPNAPTDPAHPVPWIADEPIRPDQVNPAWWDMEQDFTTYFATASLLGAGGTFHSETGKYGQLPTDLERKMAAAALRGMNQFPANAPIAGPYERIDEQGATLRTYKVGPHVVRIRPTNGVIFP